MRLFCGFVLYLVLALSSAAPVESALTPVLCETNASSLFAKRGDRYGTGFFVSPDTILTAAHVVTNGKRVYVNVNGKVEQATVSFIDNERDYAVLKTTTLCKGIYLTMAKYVPSHGSHVVAYGDFRGLGLVSPTSIEKSAGNITENSDGRGFIWSSSRIRPGFSGGPLIDSKTGNVIGINSMSGNFMRPRSAAASVIDIKYY